MGKPKGKIRRIIGFILGIIGIIITIILVKNIIKLNIVPTKYFRLFMIIEIIGNILSMLFLTRKKIFPFILGILCIILLTGANLVANSYVKTTHNYIQKTFTDYVVETVDYIVLTNQRNPVNTMEEVGENQTFYYFKYSKRIDDALKELGAQAFVPTDSVSNTLNEMNQNSNIYLVISKGNYEYLIDSSNLIDRNNYKIIKNYTVSYKSETNKEVKDSFTIYLNGVDFTGIMRDFNMLITVNTKTKKVLLTSILRGYYIDVPAYNIKDTLMCLGSLDSEVSKEALEKLFDIKIDYTVNINTNSLVDVVDTLGGIEFCSDYSFQTTHALVKDTYDDRGKQKLYVEKGCRNYNGIQILTIARERKNLRNNERGRINNCKKIMMSIGRKSLTTTSLLNYQQVLESYNNLYTTDMNKDIILKLAKSALENYSSYQIEEQQVDGQDGFAPGHLGTVEVGVTFPDMNQVNAASNKIKETLK